MLTPDRLPHRSPKPLVFLLVAIFAAGVLVPSALAKSQGSAARAPSLRGLHPGETGPAVRKLQRMLARLGYPVKVDGQFGPHTATMVRTLRADAGLDRSSRVLLIGSEGDTDPEMYARIVGIEPLEARR